MGGAFRAAGAGIDAIEGSPASIAASRRYQVQLGGGWDFTSHFGSASAGVIDSTDPGLAAGMVYHIATLGRGDNHRIFHLTSLALALPISDAFALAISGHYVVESGLRSANAVTGDAGLMIRPVSFLSFAVTAHNLVDIRNADVTRYYSVGSALLLGPFNFSADLKSDLGLTSRQLAFGLGAEFVLGITAFRGGYARNNRTQSSYLSGGLGLFGDGAGLDIGYRQEVGGTHSRLLSLSFQIRN